MNNLKNSDFYKIDRNWLEPANGRVLVSEPFSGEFFFEKSVVYIVSHGAEGTFGFILNKPILNDKISFVAYLGKYPWNIWFGGPVETEKIFFIHTIPNLIPNSICVGNGIYWGGNFDNVMQLIEEGRIRDNQIRFFVGYSGWEANQLQKEINENFWMVGTLDSKIVMDTDVDSWKEAVSNLGGRYKLWQNLPPDPSLN